MIWKKQKKKQKGCFFHFSSLKRGWLRGWSHQTPRDPSSVSVQGMLLLQQPAEIKVVSISHSCGRFSASFLWCFSCYLYDHQRHQRSLMHCDQNPVYALAQVLTVISHICKHLNANADAKEKENDNCHGCLSCLWNQGEGKRVTLRISPARESQVLKGQICFFEVL